MADANVPAAPAQDGQAPQAPQVQPQPQQPIQPPQDGVGAPAPPMQQVNVNAIAAAAAAALLANMPPPPPPAQDMRPALLSLLDGKLPVFSGSKGEDATAHLLKFEDHITDLLLLAAPNAAINGQRAQVEKFKRTLTGKARKWFDHIPLPANIPQLRLAFMDKYGKDPTRTEDLMSMSQGQMRPGEAVEAFGERISEAMVRLECAPEMVRDFFLMGLPVDMAMWIRNKPDIQTYARAMHYAKEWIKYKASQTPTQSSDRGVHFKTEKVSDDMYDLLSEIKGLHLMTIKNTKNERPPTPYPNTPRELV